MHPTDMLMREHARIDRVLDALESYLCQELCNRHGCVYSPSEDDDSPWRR
jgi:hypothetical protein